MKLFLSFDLFIKNMSCVYLLIIALENCSDLVLIMYVVNKIISDTLLLFTKKLFVSICHAIILAMMNFHWFILAADLHK